jgi:hypothetical protein
MNLYSIDSLLEKLNNNDLTLKEILSIREKLAKPFKKHPLGFYVCTLIEEGVQKIRLHYWVTSDSKEIQSLDLMIHDHIFNFKSWVFSGAIENIEYQQSNVGLKYNLFSTYYNENSSILRREAQSLLVTEKNVRIISKGDSYEMSAGVLHKTRALEDMTFTILYTQETDLKNPVVLAYERLLESEIVFERSEIHEIDMQNYLSRLKI